HGHDDHLGDALELSKSNKAVIIAPNELALYCESQGATVHPMHIGGSFKFPFGRVKLTPAWHGSAVIKNGQFIYTGCPCGFIIEFEGKLIYHAGDTGLFGDMKLIGEEKLDYALLPIGDNYVMGPDDAIRAAQMLKAKLTIPMHYNTFPIIEQDPHEFVQKLQKIGGLDGQVMEPGDVLLIK
ncbi:MAG: metal-dependent hydrolase, partial [Peptococcia bacterium]